MRLALAIALSVLGLGMLRADEPLVTISIRGQPAYIVPESYGRAHKALFLESFTDFLPTVEFWTPTEDQALVAERALRDWVRSGADDPTQVIPDMARHPENYPAEEIAAEKAELKQIDANLDAYTRQFVGIIVDGRRLIHCNYTIVRNSQPATGYIFMQKNFVDHDKDMHFLQADYDPETRQCSNLGLVGLWNRLVAGMKF